MEFDFLTNKPVFTSQRGQPISQQMLDVARMVGASHNAKVDEACTRTVLDVGLPYGMRAVPAAAQAAGIEEWIADFMLDAAIGAID